MRRILLVAAAAAPLAACTLEPAYVRPAPAVPSTWPVGTGYASQPAAPARVGYRDVFKDPRLQAVIAQALARNQDLAAAVANVRIARAQADVQRAALLPHVNATATGTETHPTSASASAGDTTRSYEAAASLSAFEVDLFGRLRSLSHSAFEQYLATADGMRAARLSLVGETADAWLTLAADRTLLAIATDTAASAQTSVDLTRARLNGGVASAIDLSQAETVLQQAKSDAAALRAQVAQDRNALELLAGGPVPDADLPASIEGLGAALAEVPAGLDSRVLLQRPDVSQAEHRLRAANAEIGAARAAFFPTISLTGLAGAASPQLASLFSGGHFTWQGEAGASLPLFAGGANVANLAAAKGERALATAQYQSAIQTAFREVADALARRGTIQDQLAAQAALAAAAQRNFDLSDARYRQGVDAYLTTLDAQRTLYSARRSLATSRLTAAENLVALYQALGNDPSLDAVQGAAGAVQPPPRA